MGTYTTNPNAKGHIWPLDHVMVCPDRYSPNMRRINEVHLAMYRSQHPSYDRLSGIGPGAGQRRTRPSPDANGLARAYPQQRIETSTRPPAVGSGDYVANPRFGIQHPCCAVWDPETMWPICRRRHAAAATPPPPRRRSRHSPDAVGLATCH